MNFLVSVDPGKEHLGVALWSLPEGTLLRAGRLEGQQAGLSGLLGKWLRLPNWDLAIELPQVYSRAKSKARPRDLIDLAVTVGMVSGACTGQVTVYKPHEWKGSLPKPTKKAQPYPVKERLLAALSADELETIALPKNWKEAMDVWDAVGIGMRYLRDRGLRK